MTTVKTAAHFLVAWFATSPLTGVYNTLDVPKEASALNVAASSLVQTAKGWVVAMPLGCVGRGIVEGYVPPMSFVVVTLVATLILLASVRALAAVVAHRSAADKALKY